MDGTTESDLARDFWVEQAARLIHIRDPQIPVADAEALASALWERPIGNQNDDAAQTLKRCTLSVKEQVRDDQNDGRDAENPPQ